MIARIWHAKVPVSKQDEYLDLMRKILAGWRSKNAHSWVDVSQTFLSLCGMFAILDLPKWSSTEAQDSTRSRRIDCRLWVHKRVSPNALPRWAGTGPGWEWTSAVTDRVMHAIPSQRALRFVFVANVISMPGSGMNSAAVAWYILEARHSEMALGTFALLQTVPAILMLPLFNTMRSTFEKMFR